mmetsp:Transcript_8392/g.12502  ORF Transcript_8392/g.12502 Transcript_8392/m.12502 type:complete len:445 (+) Transcript_8392:139-1473(+)|eukprot:CAMPEP_0185018508 /NCGR_PEP_ID=MMETSP1103-20130426/1211_1 /TAXON_ID=36769 /ORGANISM="Paraphysomonas bandaiensis, Strain Caron Lab Isolate" /LENGTH=444 /DNA_ID=CAMNT_0027548345 /DNA_START=131 /DNA_END=1465 /DNA_ORIENTATION=-
MSHSEDEFSDELDEFEESIDETKHNKPSTVQYNKPYDEAYEVSQDLSVAESFDGRRDAKQSKEQKLTNDKYDEAVEISQSMDQHITPPAKNARPARDDIKAELNKSNSISNRPFDEALEFSRSGSDESVDTQSGRGNQSKPVAQVSMEIKAPAPADNFSMGAAQSKAAEVHRQNVGDDDDEESSEEEDDEGEGEQEFYEGVEGAYNPKDYQYLNVAAEVRDLFQYIERYKPHEVELETSLKCFIPEYIPAIGEIDGFIKVPRPDGEDDDLGFKILDEPATVQSDPTVLELQLRASSKKQQYGDVVVRSIENAEKNPGAIAKWIQSISDLHRSKPPPQVHYKKNMPDIETLMDVWPEQFEAALETLQLPSPDLDLSLAEYAKVLCSILDIPTYDNPVESLHVMFSLYMDFRDNPHFQAMRQNAPGAEGKDDFGGADVLEINQGYK